MSFKQFLFLLVIFISSTLYSVNTDFQKNKTCYDIVPDTEHSYLTDGKHPSWQVKVKTIEQKTKTEAWSTVTQQDIERGYYCYTETPFTISNLMIVLCGLISFIMGAFAAVFVLVIIISKFWEFLE